jgi:hypothetical protein
MRSTPAALLVPAILTVTLQPLGGCAERSVVAADCARIIRHEGTTYVEHGFADPPATRAGHADDAECDDQGPEARGPWFPDDPRQVDVWTFDGHDADEVLGVRQPGGGFRVFVAEGVDADPVIRSLNR